MRSTGARASAAIAAALLAGAAMTASAGPAASAPIPGSAHGAARTAGSAGARDFAFAPGYTLIDCTSQPVVMPERLVLACAGARDYLSALRWDRWGPTSLGAGVEWINDCNPSCARGHFHRYRARVTLWRARALGKVNHYTRMTIVYPHRQPVFGGRRLRSRTIRLWGLITAPPHPGRPPRTTLPQ